MAVVVGGGGEGPMPGAAVPARRVSWEGGGAAGEGREEGVRGTVTGCEAIQAAATLGAVVMTTAGAVVMGTGILGCVGAGTWFGVFTA